MRGVGEDGWESREPGEAHGAADAVMVAHPKGRDSGAENGEEGGEVDGTGSDALVRMGVVWLVGAYTLEEVFEVVGDEVEAHEE